MLARKTQLLHPYGDVLELPLLIPSFSSKGYDFITVGDPPNERFLSETNSALIWSGPYLKESLLLSAFDLFHEHYDSPEDHLLDTSLVFIDSGGYELAPEFDSTEPKIVPQLQRDFTLDNYHEVIDALTSKVPTVPLAIANYDWGTKNVEYDLQIAAAQKLFNRHPDSIRNFIVKPPSRDDRTVDITTLLPHIEKLRAFHILGVTEKELGKNLLDRLSAIARLRVAMDAANVRIPIHVWGGLDPIITPLYFFAGAEIFDGVSWLRYGYYKGLAVNRECFSVLYANHGVGTPKDHGQLLSLNENMSFLRNLKLRLREFVESGATDFDMFDDCATALRQAYRAMADKIPALRGAR